jgi:hypothetical protein
MLFSFFPLGDSSMSLVACYWLEGTAEAKAGKPKVKKGLVLAVTLALKASRQPPTDLEQRALTKVFNAYYNY